MTSSRYTGKRTGYEGEEEQIVVTDEQIDYIASWLIMDAERYHDVLGNMKDLQDREILPKAIEAAIEAWNGGARND